MADPTSVDQAFDRYTRLSAIVRRARDEAFAGGALGEREDVVRQGFNELTRLVEHLALLDMCASFEGDFANNLDGATREAARIVTESYGLDYFVQLKDRLVRSPRDYRSLGRICELLTQRPGQMECISASVLQQLRELAEIRNRITHGRPGDEALGVTLGQTHALLNGIISELWNPAE